MREKQTNNGTVICPSCRFPAPGVPEEHTQLMLRVPWVFQQYVEVIDRPLVIPLHYHNEGALIEWVATRGTLRFVLRSLGSEPRGARVPAEEITKDKPLVLSPRQGWEVEVTTTLSGGRDRGILAFAGHVSQLLV